MQEPTSSKKSSVSIAGTTGVLAAADKDSAQNQAAGPLRWPCGDPFEGFIPVGEGRVQFLLLASAVISASAFLCQVLSYRLTARVMDHWCQQPERFANLSVAEWKELAIPREEDGSFSRCTMRDPPEAGSLAMIVRCSAWDFDLGAYGNTIVSDFSLVCDRHWLIEATLLAYSVASMIWLPLMGAAADRVGRKTVAHTSLMALLLAGITNSVSDSFQFYVVMRTIVSATTSSIMVVLFVLLYEVSTRNRCYLYWTLYVALPATVVPALFFASDKLRLSWKGVQLLLMMPTALMLPTFCTLDESHNWLLATWKTREAQSVAMRVAAANGMPQPEFLEAFNRVVVEMAQQRAALADQPHAILSPQRRATTMVLAFIWTAEIFSYNLINLNNILTAHGYV
ncbi:hypothetical protein HPB49_008124 [Dermacentor silvarum]|uniref:Uncharacterized protein n=1 Tax=Dermacentor silvarum TaxID=543639 RepID=A0ACB8CK26_DERSI|nr:hypothetical protein HPB49_008124 [Dermacentor silvarum]